MTELENWNSFEKVNQILSYRGRDDLVRIFNNSNFALNESNTYGSRWNSILTSVEIYSPIQDYEKILKVSDRDRKDLLSAFHVIYPVRDGDIEISAIEFFVDPSAPIPKKGRHLSKLDEIDFSYIKEQIDKSDEKLLLGDYEGAITNSRTLIETICKYILDKKGEEYKRGDDLPRLYKKTTKMLNMDPSQHSEQYFKEILSGCFAVVNGLANVRNELSDSHGKSFNNRYTPAKRHAVLCVAVSQALADYLYSSFTEVLNRDES